jgi:hypothetical protein
MDLNYIIKIACNFIFIALSRASCHLPRPLLSNDQGFNNVVIESDSAIAIGLVEHDTSPLHPYAPLIKKNRQFQTWIGLLLSIILLEKATNVQIGLPKRALPQMSL